MSADRIGNQCPRCSEFALREYYGAFLKHYPENIKVIANYFVTCRNCDWSLQIDDTAIGQIER